MAHELEIRDGRASFVSTRQSAWHQQGVVLETAPSFEDAIALARLDYTVEKRQTHLIVPASDGTEQKVPTGAYITLRTDTMKELGVVEHGYHVVQNVDAFRILRPLVEEEGIAHIETAGVLRDGADAWMLLKLDLDRFGDRVQEVFQTETKPYILIANNHSGRRGILVALTPIRVVCANTLGGAEGHNYSDQIVVRHTASADEKLIEAAHSLWGNIIERYQRLAEAYALLKSIYLTRAEFQTLVVDAVAQDPRKNRDWNPDARMAESVVARYEQKQQALIALWTGGTGHTGDRSGWEALNGCVEALDHRPDLFPLRSGVYRSASLLDGRLRQMKTTVFSNLIDHALKSRN